MSEKIAKPSDLGLPTRTLQETVLEMINIAYVLGFSPNDKRFIHSGRSIDVTPLSEWASLLEIIDIPMQGWD